MHVKIQGGGKNAGVYANAGSSASLVSYLQHEDAERLAEGKDVFPFFTGTGVAVSPGEVIEKLDRNHKKLCHKDSKFYHIDINPSKDEIPYLGSSDTEIVANATVFCQKVTEEYAKNFHHDKIHGAEDIMIFFKPHFTRGESRDFEFHIHGIVSRKDIHNDVKLSPMSNHRGTDKGPVQGGFDRKKFQMSCEKIFDETFGYKRKIADTFEYKLIAKKGSFEELEALKEKMPEQERIDLTERQAAEIYPEISSVADGWRRISKARRDEFWNEYHSKHKPVYDTAKKACDDTYRLYVSAKDQYSLTSKEISEQYKLLRESYIRMREQSDSLKTIQKSRKFVNAASTMLLFVNPTAAIALKLTASIIAKAKTSASKEARKSLFQQAESIKKTIEDLKRQQEVLGQQKADRLSAYLEKKEDKSRLLTELDALKAELQVDLSQRMKEHIERYISSDQAMNLVSVINGAGCKAGHYHLVPGVLVELGNDTFRWILYTDGTTGDNKQIHKPQAAAPQLYGESYIDFSFNDKGELIATIEADNYQARGVSGRYNLKTGKGEISERTYAGKKSTHDGHKPYKKSPVNTVKRKK
jgi:hypothetical protein